MSIASVVAAGCLAATTVTAHHSAALAYDQSKVVDAQGAVTKILVRNPHSWVFLESSDHGEKIEWQIEMGGASSMAWPRMPCRSAPSSRSPDIRRERLARTA
jgi:hypothetical protein